MLNGCILMSIKKFTEKTGVSYSTVSRVLSDPDYKCSSEEIRLKILKAARGMNYIPNAAACDLRLGKTDLLLYQPYYTQ